MSRAPSAASSRHAPSASATARGRSTQSSHTTSGHSTIGLFVTNLRLLDLDKRSDWPGITVQTFSTRDAQQNQKNRLRCVEWALYRLFEIWDAEEARDVSPCLCSRDTHMLTAMTVEAAAVLPAARTTAVAQLTCRLVPLSQRAQEEWGPGKRDHSAQDHAG